MFSPVTDIQHVKYLNGTSPGNTSVNQESAKTELYGEKVQYDREKIGKVDEYYTEVWRQAVRDGTVIDIVELCKNQGGYTQGVTDTPETAGKTVINNWPKGLIIGSTLTADGKPIITSHDANKSAAMGDPTHGFFYHDASFLLDSAKKYATLGENEVFAYRDIDDLSFVRDTLDFFTNGNYTDADVKAMQKQMTDVVNELAQQIKNGENPDFSKLQTKLSIGGTDVTISQLLDFQKVGEGLKDSFNNISVGSLFTESYAEMGLAKAIGNQYASDKGKIGDMFSAAIDRLYEKGTAKIKKLFSEPNLSGSRYQWTPRQKDAVQTGLKIADMFSKLNTNSKNSMTNDFSATLAKVRSMVQNHCSQFGIAASDIGLSGDTAGITKYFQSWLTKI